MVDGEPRVAADPPPPAEEPVAHHGSRTALAGLVAAALFVAGWLLLDQAPPIGATDEELKAYLSDPERRRRSVVAGLWVLPFGAIAFIWFMAAFRDRLLRSSGREHPLYATVQLVSGTVFIVAVFIAGATELAVVRMVNTDADASSYDAVRAMLALGSVIAQVVALRTSAVFIAVGATRSSLAGLAPRWFVLTSYAVAAALLLVSSTWRPVVLLTPAWIAGVSVILLSRRHNRPDPTEA